MWLSVTIKVRLLSTRAHGHFKEQIVFSYFNLEFKNSRMLEMRSSLNTWAASVYLEVVAPQRGDTYGN